MSLSNGLMIAGVLAVALVLFTRSRGNISGADARALVGAGAALVDVRSRDEFAAGHIEGARNISLDELPGRLAEVGARDKPVVVYCASGMRSAAAAASLKQSGFTQVYDLGAKSRW